MALRLINKCAYGIGMLIQKIALSGEHLLERAYILEGEL